MALVRYIDKNKDIVDDLTSVMIGCLALKISTQIKKNAYLSYILDKFEKKYSIQLFLLQLHSSNLFLFSVPNPLMKSCEIRMYNSQRIWM